MKINGLISCGFSNPANFTSIAWFKASVSTHPPLMPVVEPVEKVKMW